MNFILFKKVLLLLENILLLHKNFFLPDKCKKKNFLRFNITMINLSLDEPRLIAQDRNVRDYENNSEKDLIKALSEPKPKIRINKKKLEEIRKDFNELIQKFSKQEIDKHRKAFYDIKN